MASEVTTKPPRTFFDTNVLVYSEDPIDPAKRARALELTVEHRRQHTGVVSLQVLQEFFNALTGKLKLDAAIARAEVEFYARFHVFQPGVEDVLAAIDLYRLHRVSFWDALILCAAKQSGCRILLSEDMQHGQVIDGVRIVNPFL